MRKLLPTLLLSVALVLPFMAQEPRDKDRLGMALEYFQSGKYHEALLLFERLDKEYQLNPRYHAYMGVCCYYEWQYEDACRYLDEAIPQLDAFAPHERSVYYYTDGESHFQLKQYAEAIPYYERALTVCYENEKGDIHYRLGLCHMFASEWQMAHDHYQQALDNYLTYRDTPEMRARIHQTAHMMKGCEDHLPKRPATAAHAGEGNDLPVITMSSDVEPSDSLSVITMSSGSEPSDSIPSVTIPTITVTDIAVPTIAVPTIVLPPLQPVATTSSATEKNIMAPHPVVRDTIRSEVPKTVNIEELYEQKVEVRE